MVPLYRTDFTANEKCTTFDISAFNIYQGIDEYLDNLEVSKYTDRIENIIIGKNVTEIVKTAINNIKTRKVTIKILSEQLSENSIKLLVKEFDGDMVHDMFVGNKLLQEKKTNDGMMEYRVKGILIFKTKL